MFHCHLYLAPALNTLSTGRGQVVVKGSMSLRAGELPTKEETARRPGMPPPPPRLIIESWPPPRQGGKLAVNPGVVNSRGGKEKVAFACG